MTVAYITVGAVVYLLAGSACARRFRKEAGFAEPIGAGDKALDKIMILIWPFLALLILVGDVTDRIENAHRRTP